MSFQRLAPSMADLQTGDLVWPRADKQIVFFQDNNPQAAPWLAEQALMAASPMSQSSEQTELVDRFIRDCWVGHVALIELMEGVPWVVDATPHRSGPATPGQKGVATQTYQAFLDDHAHTQSNIWHGRLKPEFVDQPDGFGQRLVNAAKQHLGKPYSISPLGLGNAEDFYCSKLIWHALRDALGIALEKRGLQVPQPWFTPWDVMQTECVQLLYSPAGKSYRG